MILIPPLPARRNAIALLYLHTLGYPLFNSLRAFKWVCLVKELGLTSRYPCRQSVFLLLVCLQPACWQCMCSCSEPCESCSTPRNLSSSFPSREHFAFSGCLSQHLCPQRSCLCLNPVPLCVHVCDCLRAFYLLFQCHFR